MIKKVICTVIIAFLVSPHSSAMELACNQWMSTKVSSALENELDTWMLTQPGSLHIVNTDKSLHLKKADAYELATYASTALKKSGYANVFKTQNTVYFESIININATSVKITITRINKKDTHYIEQSSTFNYDPITDSILRVQTTYNHSPVNDKVVCITT